MYAFFVRKYGNKRYRMYNGTFSELKCAGLFYELLKKAGLPQDTQESSSGSMISTLRNGSGWEIGTASNFTQDQR